MSTNVYIVTSFNTGGNGKVIVHVVTDDLTTAKTVCASVLEACKAEKAKTNEPACGVLVELCDLSFNKPLLGSAAWKLFQGQTFVTPESNNADLTPPQSTTSGPSDSCATPSSTTTRPPTASAS